MEIPHIAVAQALREVSESVILPGYHALKPEDIEEKSPGEIVTSVDRQAEAFLMPRLKALLMGSRVVGEEAASADPSLLEDLNHGLVWLLDPIDGTAHFAKGPGAIPEACEKHSHPASGGFAVMLALLRGGETLASWIYQPLQSALWSAERGSGSRRDGRKILMPASRTTPPLPVVVMDRFLPPAFKEALGSGAWRGLTVTRGSQSAGIDYPALIEGRFGFILYWRTLPWDHAPGALLVSEAGGKAARLDGAPFDIHSSKTGLLVAPDGDCWAAARKLFPPL